ncbi:hypothetical protein ACHAXA_000939 [Cyclostephanos tholiformis]|uniref:Uncharacterized protein n=1 Tax=Cyclostephanos tholiformis TaxID=382380 RepID=A0ABD3RGW4_9STRA
MTRLLSLLLLLKASTPTDASVSIALSNCTNVTFPDEDNVVRELCFSVRMLGPPITMTTLPNGTEYTEYVGGSSMTYSFEGDLMGLTTVVSWGGEGDATEDCVAAADGEDCQRCAICNDGGSFDADCTNLEHGRIVECDEVPLWGVDEFERPFFPFSSAFEYTAGNSNITHYTSDTTTAVETTPTDSASAAAFLQGGLLAIVGTVAMLAL